MHTTSMLSYLINPRLVIISACESFTVCPSRLRNCPVMALLPGKKNNNNKLHISHIVKSQQAIWSIIAEKLISVTDQHVYDEYHSSIFVLPRKITFWLTDSDWAINYSTFYVLSLRIFFRWSTHELLCLKRIWLEVHFVIVFDQPFWLV